MPVRNPTLPSFSAFAGLSGVTRLASRRRWQSADPRSAHLESRSGPFLVGCGVYENGRRVEAPRDPAGALRVARAAPGRFVWVGLFEPTETEMSVIAAEYGLHPVAVEDAVNAHQRPKLERYGDVLFLVLKTALYVGNHADVGVGDVVQTGEVMLFVGSDFVVSVRHGLACELQQVRSELENHPEMLARGPMAVLHAVTDLVVDDYDGVADAISDDIDELEDKVFESVHGTDVQRVYQLKRELLEFSRAVAPLARPLQILQRDENLLVNPEIATYLRDVEDHVHQVSERIAGNDDLVVNLLNATLTQLALRQNDDMRKMSAWLAMGAVPTMVAGIYGMNFEHMPELRTQYGYPIALLGIATVCSFLYRKFKRSGWL